MTEIAAAAPMDELEAPEAWAPQSLSDLDWALSRVADAEREIAENQAMADAAIARLKLRMLALNERAAKSADFFRGKVAAYCEVHRAELLGGGRKKSRTLLHGTVAWRKTGGRLEVRDADAALDWARAQPVEAGLVRIREELDKPAVHAHHKATGEVPPGIELTPEVEELRIDAVSEVSHGG